MLNPRTWCIHSESACVFKFLDFFALSLHRVPRVSPGVAAPTGKLFPPTPSLATSCGVGTFQNASPVRAARTGAVKLLLEKIQLPAAQDKEYA